MDSCGKKVRMTGICVQEVMIVVLACGKNAIPVCCCHLICVLCKVKEEKLTAGTITGCTSSGVHVPCIALIPGESYHR